MDGTGTRIRPGSVGDCSLLPTRKGRVLIRSAVLLANLLDDID